MEHDLTRLPRWARHEIERLRKDVAQMDRDMAEVVGAVPTAIEVDPTRSYRRDGVPRLYLPDRYSVRFSVAGGIVDVKIEDSRLEVIGHGDGAASDMYVAPCLANMVAIEFFNRERGK